MQHNRSPFARFFALLSKLPHLDKDDLVWQYSHMLTTSLNELYSKRPDKYQAMIADMQAMVNELALPNSRIWDAKPEQKGQSTAELKKYRSAILLRLQKHGIDTTNWDIVNRFMRQPRIAGKTLGEMSIAELKAFIPKIESILQKNSDKKQNN